MFDLPLSEATMSEVLARVTFRWIELRWRRGYYRNMAAETALSDIAAELHWHGFKTLGLWVFAYKRLWTPIYTCNLIRDQFIIDARRGMSWRRVAYPQYKSHRRGPRVTNRGATTRRVSEGD